MKTYTYTFAAGQRLLLPFAGTFFYVVDTLSPIDIEFISGTSQGQGERVESSIAGDWFQPDGGFASVIITSAAAQTIKFLVAQGRAGRSSVVGSVNVRTLPGESVNVVDLGALSGVNFTSTAALTAGTPLNVLAAATNLAGVRVHDARSACVNATGVTNCTLVCKATAPASVADGLILVAADFLITITALFFAYGKLTHARAIPAGVRLDFMVGISDTAGQVKHVDYTIL